MFDALFGGKTELEKELEEKRARMEHERKMFESAQNDWLLKSGLVEIMVEQTEEWAAQCGLDSWDDALANLRTTGLDFDPRNPEHREIAEHIGQVNVGSDFPPEVYVVVQEDASNWPLVRAFAERRRAKEYAKSHSNLRVDKVKVGDI